MQCATLVRDKIRHVSHDLEAILEEITPSAIDNYLYTVGLPDLDLIIRTSGEIRLSGFLLWQSISLRWTGQNSAESTFSAPFDPFSSARGASGNRARSIV